MKRKVGRPKVKEPKIPFGTRLKESLGERLYIESDKQKRSVSALIEIAVEEKYLNK